MRINAYMLAACFLFVFISLNGQRISRTIPIGDYLVEVNAWDISSGLPSSFITNMQISKTGHLFLYFPNSGLYVFDGQKFRQLKVTISEKEDYAKLSEGNEALINEDQNGNLWIRHSAYPKQLIICTPTGGECQTFKSYTGISPDSISLSDGKLKVTCINNNFYFSSIENPCIWRYDTVFKEVLRLDNSFSGKHISPTPIEGQFIYYDDNSNSLRIIDKNGKDIHPPYYQAIKSPTTKPIITILNDRIVKEFSYVGDDHYDLLFTEDGIKKSANTHPFFYFKKKSPNTNEQIFHTVLNRKTREISVLHREEVIIQHLNDFMFKEFSLVINNFEHILNVEKDVHWYTSQSHLIQLKFKPNKFSQVDLTINTPSVRSIRPFGTDTLLVSTYLGDAIIGKTGSVLSTSKPHLKFSVIRDVEKVGQKYWFATEKGLFLGVKSDKNSFTLIRKFTEIVESDIFFLPEKNQLLIAGDGIIKLNLETEEISKEVVLNNQEVYSFFQSTQGEVWVAYADGLYNYSQKKNYLQGIQVYHIHEDKEGIFWLATNIGLIEWKLDATNYQIYDTSNGLTRNKIHCVYPGQTGDLWMTSNFGLMQFNKKTHKVKAYFARDGLPSNEFNQFAHYQAQDGQLYLGGISGVINFHPDQFSWYDIEHLAPISAARIEIYDNKNERCFQKTLDGFLSINEIRIPSNSHRIEFTFNFAHFGETTDVIKEWRIYPEYPIWETSNENQITFHLIDFGQKELEIRVSKKGHPFEKSTIKITLNKPIPFYKTKLFTVILALGILSISLFISTRITLYERKKLRHLVKLKTKNIELQKEQILAQKKELQKINNYRSKFFKNICHDFKTPLNIIIGMLDRLEENKNTPKNIKHHTARVRENAMRINNLIDQVFELSKSNNKELTLNESTIEWGHFCRRILQSFLPLAEQKQIKLIIDQSPSKLIFLKLDLNKTEQIIRNLIDNALKFTPSHGKIIFSFQEETETIRFEINDSGSGIEDKDKKKVFDRYYQGINTDDITISGLGIGLSLCQDYVNLMNGSIRVKDSFLGGACIEVILPKKLSDEFSKINPIKTNKHSTQIQISEPRIIFNQNKACLLVVEDDLDLLNFYKEELATKYSLLLASNGMQALELINRSHLNIDLVISDVMMPGVDGFKLLKLFKNTLKYQSIPFILITALSSDKQRLNALKIGVDTYISKPFSINELIIRIENLLRYKQLRYEFKRALENDEFEEYQKMSLSDSNDSLTTLQREWLSKLEKVIKARIADPNLKVKIIAAALQVSERTLRNKIKAFTGLNPSEYIMKVRLARALYLLESRYYSTVSEVCHHIGLKNASNFTKQFKAEYGRLPSSYLLR